MDSGLSADYKARLWAVLKIGKILKLLTLILYSYCITVLVELLVKYCSHVHVL